MHYNTYTILFTTTILQCHDYNMIGRISLYTMSTIQYNTVQYCSPLYNMKNLIVVMEFSDDVGACVVGTRHTQRSLRIRVRSHVIAGLGQEGDE